MAFTITRVIAGPTAFAVGEAVEVVDPPVFGITAVAYPPPAADKFPLFLQWRAAGVDLGLPTVRVVDFVGEDIEVTRGVGENYHVITVRLLSQPSMFFTSRLYPVVASEDMNSSMSLPLNGSLWVPPTESMTQGFAVPLDGTLVATLYNAYTGRDEELDQDLALPQSGTLVTVLKTITMKANEANSHLATPITGTLVVILIAYTNARADELNSRLATPLSGTLT